jgi:hypothetical protein
MTPQQRITTKAEFLALHQAGRLGNIVPSWDTVEDAAGDGYDGPVMIRFKVPNSPFTTPHVPMADVPRVLAELAAKGAPVGQSYLTHMTADCNRELNAEVWRGPGGLYLHYATCPGPLRDALLADGKHVEGSAAVAILRAKLDPSSYDDLTDLLDRHPDAVIELTAYEHPIGALADSGRNTIFWEVRNY